MEYISQQVPSTVVVEVDHDDQTETDALLKKHFLNRYRNVQTQFGDWFFQHGEYDLELRYGV